ncbi:MAG: alkaline phosphatase family protein [Deltaproteobacteria bacterium]|nr:MAG: alkaline phosphatase family protein [Deltaproteobacteria bacterium]
MYVFKRCFATFLLITLLTLIPSVGYSYIDPGTTGYVFSVLAPILSGILLVLVFFYRQIKRGFYFVINGLKKFPMLSAVSGIVLISIGTASYFLSRETEVDKMKKYKFERVILLGIDGIDPKILEDMMAGGELPNFSRLREIGGFAPLQTSIPPESPVAWSTIATGANPGYFGIFDFILRNPKNYLPDLSILRIDTKALAALKGSSFLPAMKGTPFWEITARADIPTTVIRWPVTFPPVECSGPIKLLSGQGVPDLRGTLGRYGFYTTGSIPEDQEGKEKVTWVSFNDDGFIETSIFGPVVSRITGRKPAEIPMKLRPDYENSEIGIKIDGSSYRVNEGEWSSWIPLKFDLGLLQHANGICRFYLTRLKPELELYLSPIQIDPSDPTFIVSYPDDYSAELARAIGTYHTLGIPEDTNALVENRYGEEAFLKICDELMDEREKMLWFELKELKKGLLAIDFDTTDRIQHIFWRSRDPEHPFYQEDFARRYGDVIPGYYRRMDKVLGRLLEYADEKTTVIVFSDHGFTTFRRAFHLNSWLVEHGFMTLKPSSSRQEGVGELFANVDWQNTRAYALGFGSIYLNLKGREGKGIVEKGGESRRVKQEIAELLTQLKDPKTDELVVKAVYAREDIYRGPYLEDAPDLIVGMRRGYRMSWQSAIGGTPEGLFEDNMKKWTGTHIIDPYYVPGILLMNQRINVENPRSIDIAPTVLACFGLSRPAEMEGTSLLK